MERIFYFIRDLLPRPPHDSNESPPPSYDLGKPWRTMFWGNQDELKQKLMDFRIKHPNVEFVRILLVGDIGAGKSSFINSVNNAFQNRITCEALTDGVGGRSFTKNYITYYIKGDDGAILPFVFNDVMGLEEGEAGAHSKDIIKALSGFLQEGYNFEHVSAINSPAYRSNPSLQDQTSCLVNVLSASTVSLMSEEIIYKMRKIREAATKLNIPQVIIMTKPDAACPLVQEDLKNIYTSKKIKEKMEVCSNLLGVPLNHIFPVKNYHEEIDPDDDINALIFKALDQIVHIACDAVKNRSFIPDDKSEACSSGLNTTEKFKPAEESYEAPEFEKPWRKMPWDKKDALEEKLRDFKLSSPGVKFVRILIIGEIGAGKSSFINSVNNVFQKRITCGALVDATSGTSFTKTFKTHYIKGKSGSHLPFVFSDIMGLEPAEGHGAHTEDIAGALMGSLKEGHNFNPVSPVSKDDVNYRDNPNVSDQTFCLVYVMAADKVSLMKDEVIQKMKLIREKASKHNLPQVLIMTKVDDVCPLVRDDLRKVYTSRKIKEKMQECSHRLGVPMNNIFPVKNYHEEVDTDDDMDVLILKALDQIVNIASDTLEQNTSAEYE